MSVLPRTLFKCKMITEKSNLFAGFRRGKVKPNWFDSLLQNKRSKMEYQSLVIQHEMFLFPYS